MFFGKYFYNLISESTGLSVVIKSRVQIHTLSFIKAM